MVRTVLRDRFVWNLREFEGSAGNGRLRNSLGWQDDTYWNVHAALVDDGTIMVGRGRGGSVSIAAPPEKAVRLKAKPAPKRA